MAPELDSNNKAKSKNTVSTNVLNDVISIETDVSSSQMIQFINKVSQSYKEIHWLEKFTWSTGINILRIFA